MEKDILYITFQVTMFVGCAMLLLFAGILVGLNKEELSRMTYAPIKELDQCTNMSLGESAYCLHDFVLPFFNYSISDDNDNRTIDDIKRFGGDCHDYNSVIYANGARQLGFDAKEIIIGIGNKSAHTFTVMYDSSGYCVLDQTNNPDCFMYRGKVNESTDWISWGVPNETV
jgi:hypothetical protein